MKLDFSTHSGKIRAQNWYSASKIKNKEIKEKLAESHKKENWETLKVITKDKLRMGKNNKADSKLLAPMKGNFVEFKYSTWKEFAETIKRKFKCFIGRHDWQIVDSYWETISEKRQVLRRISNPTEYKCSYCPKIKKVVKDDGTGKENENDFYKRLKTC